MTIYTPRTLNEAKEIATLISDKPRDCLKLHAAFGSFFGGDMATTQNNSYLAQGSPSLHADAMAGIVRRSGLCRFMFITSWDDQHCTYQCARHDEPESIVHEFTFTMEMAARQGLASRRGFKQMPKQMMRSRALTLMLRAVFPDAVSGIYSPDEMVDNMNMSDNERAAIQAKSLGEELRTPTESPRPQPVEPPNQHKAIKTTPPEELPPAFREMDPEQRPTPEHVVGRLLDVATMGSISEEEGELKPTEWDEDDLKLVTERALQVKTWRDLETFTAGLWTVANKSHNASPDELDELLKTIKSLGYSMTRLGIS